jgi:hypothetical protein
MIETTTEFSVVRIDSPVSGAWSRGKEGGKQFLLFENQSEDSIIGFFQELNFSPWRASVRPGKTGDSDGEKSDTVGSLGLAGTRSSGPPNCLHAVSAGCSTGGGVCHGMRRSSQGGLVSLPSSGTFGHGEASAKSSS